jgi:hypothetical protein
VTVASTPPGGGSATVTSYLWCGKKICQARNASNTTIRSYYTEGEYLPRTPAQTLYYGIDQIGSVGRVFASTSSAAAYGYDPYGAPLQATAPTTDFAARATRRPRRVAYFAEAGRSGLRAGRVRPWGRRSVCSSMRCFTTGFGNRRLWTMA